MIVTLSPSKGQDFETERVFPRATVPAMLEDSLLLIEELRKYDTAQIGRLMAVSDRIAGLNVQRFRQFTTPFTEANARPALYAFKGDVYRGLEVDAYGEAERAFAQDHLRILSGLYGCLRPLDLIQPYRLEMKTRLPNPRGGNLYAFWGERITRCLNRELERQQVPVLVNLASNEYFKAVKPRLLTGDLLQIVFKEVKNGKARVVAVFAKRARGMMADFIIRNRIREPEELKRF
ncbi:MAG TPA: peroxide stress protein YaaA, partial [Sedimenticola sp.]|nr:peroxide stress protein YaaA [Sedimenticola sp.]